MREDVVVESAAEGHAAAPLDAEQPVVDAHGIAVAARGVGCGQNQTELFGQAAERAANHLLGLNHLARTGFGGPGRGKEQ